MAKLNGNSIDDPDVVATEPVVASALASCSSRHSHLCPRQVLGVRIGFAGAAALGISLPLCNKRLLVFVETDGCFSDGVEAATGCSMGHRTMRVEDYGRVAATFVDVETGDAIRIAPAAGVRARASEYEAQEPRHYYAQLRAYQRMPESDLLSIVPVKLTHNIARILGRNGVRAECAVCGEEVINQRETMIEGKPTCPACATGAYYVLARVDRPCAPLEDSRLISAASAASP